MSPPQNDRTVPLSIPEFARDWIAFVARSSPMATQVVDTEGFALALQDLAGGTAIIDVRSRAVEELGGLLPRLPGLLRSEVTVDVLRNSGLPAVGAKLAWLFHRDRGESSRNPTLREARRDALAELTALLGEVFERITRRSR